MPEIIIPTPDTEQAREAQGSLLRAAEAVHVQNQTDHAMALGLIRDIGSAEKRIAALFAEPKRAAHAAHRAVCDAEGSLLRPLSAARSLVSGRCDAYETEERRRAQEEQRRLEAEARRVEAERLAAEAQEIEAAGDEELAAVVLDEALAVESGAAPAPPVVVQTRIAKVEGVASRTIWSAEVSDLKALVSYVAAHPEWIRLLQADMPALNALARSQREALAIPGVRAVSTTSRAVRA